MKKRTLLTASLALMLCPPLAYAQTDARHPLTLEQLFTLADRNSKALRPAVTGVAEAGQAVEAAQRHACRTSTRPSPGAFSATDASSTATWAVG